MDWDDESPAVPSPADPSHEEVASPETPVKTVTVSRTKWRLARAFSVLVLVLAIGAMGFILGHDVVKPAPIRSAAPRFTFPTFPSGGVGNGNSPSFQFPTTTPQNTKADAAAAKVAKKVDPGLVDITSTFASQNGTAEGTGMILTSNGLVLTNNHVVEDAATLSVRDVATNTTYVGTVVGYDLSEDVALIQLKGASGLTTIKTVNSDNVSSGEKIVQGAAAASSFLPLTDLRLTRVRLRPAGRISASTRVGLSAPSIWARTMALVAPVRTSASGGAPRKERRVPR